MNTVINRTGGLLNNHTIYDISISTSSGIRRRARALLCEKQGWSSGEYTAVSLVSNLVDCDGGVYRRISRPDEVIIKADTCGTIYIDEVSAVQGRKYSSLMAANAILGTLMKIVNPSDTYDNGEYYVFNKVDPPMGTPEHVSYFETKSGRKEVLKYPGSKRLRIIDHVTGRAVDIEREDLSEYITD
jgi:hypothetical protein